MTRRAFAVLVCTAAVAAIACGGGSSEPKAPAATPVSDATFKTIAATAAQSALIARADLPAGWTGKVPQADDTKLELSPACALFNETDPWKAAIARAESDDFSSDGDRKLTSQAVVYRTADLAQADSAGARTLLDQCAGEIGAGIRKLIIGGSADVSADVAVKPFAEDDLDGWSGGYGVVLHAASASGGNALSVAGGVQWKLSGRAIVTLEYSGTETAPIDPGTLRALKSLLAKRLADADATLPD